jgi:cytochrome P450
MTQLLYAEFEDETGTVRRLTREELLAYINIVAMAGNETTRLILSWAIKLLAENPDQRHVLVEDPSWVANAVEESLRCEPPSLAVGRYVAHDVEFHGQIVPAGAVMSLLVASANRDERHIEDPDCFDVKRDIDAHRTFGFGPHFCLGHALARLETRLVLEEMLKRFPDWHVEMQGAQFRQSGAEIRGWEVLPVVVP